MTREPPDGAPWGRRRHGAPFAGDDPMLPATPRGSDLGDFWRGVFVGAVLALGAWSVLLKLLGVTLA